MLHVQCPMLFIHAKFLPSQALVEEHFRVYKGYRFVLELCFVTSSPCKTIVTLTTKLSCNFILHSNFPTMSHMCIISYILFEFTIMAKYIKRWIVCFGLECTNNHHSMRDGWWVNLKFPNHVTHVHLFCHCGLFWDKVNQQSLALYNGWLVVG